MKRLLLVQLLVLLFGMLCICGVAQAQPSQPIQPLQRGSYKKIIAAHAGKPFMVAMWSVSCTHCGADLELFHQLQQKYPDFKLVLIATDTPEAEDVIAGALQRYQLLPAAADKPAGKVESWVFADSFSERLRYEIDPQWYGELPRTYFIDANGKARGISGVLEGKATEQWVRDAR